MCEVQKMTKRRANLIAILAFALVLVLYLRLLNIDLASDAQAGIGYIIYGPLGLIPAVFAAALTKLILGAWNSEPEAHISTFTVFLGLVYTALVFCPLIYVGIRSGAI